MISYRYFYQAPRTRFHALQGLLWQIVHLDANPNGEAFGWVEWGSNREARLAFESFSDVADVGPIERPDPLPPRAVAALARHGVNASDSRWTAVEKVVAKFGGITLP